MKVLDGVSVILKQKDRKIWSISPDATVYEAIEMMSDKEIGALLVIESGKLVGLFSEREYARKVILKGRSSKDTLVKEIMVSPPLTISLNCTVDEAMHMMTDHRVRHLPVVDANGAALGVVSIGDLVKWTITSHEQTIGHLQSYIAGQS
jgi:CBS domain-containing protein